MPSFESGKLMMTATCYKSGNDDDKSDNNDESENNRDKICLLLRR